MYLLAFVTLIISLLGMYTQVLAIEVARVASQQTSIAGAMLSWHKAAVSMAASIVDTDQYAYVGNGYTGSGCSLTDHSISWSFLSGGGLPACPSPLTAPCAAGVACSNSMVDYISQVPPLIPNQVGFGTITDSAGNCTHYSTCAIVTCDATSACNGGTVPYTMEAVHLPPYYQTSNYQFFSALYQDPGSHTDVVVTFIASPNYTNNTAGFLTLANGAQISTTSGDLMKQLQLAGGKEYMFGHISSSAGTTSTVQVSSIRDTSTSTPITLSFPLPGTFGCTAAPCPLDGAIAVVSSPDGL